MEFSLGDGQIRLRGCLDVDVSATGARPVRLPPWARARVPDVAMRTVVEMASGVRLCFTTDADAVAFDLAGVQIAFEGTERTGPMLDVVVDGAPARSVALAGCSVLWLDPVDRSRFRFEPGGGDTTVHLDGLGAGRKQVEAWLPTDTSVEVRGVTVPDGCSIEAPTALGPVWVHYGSSISHGMDAGRPLATWPAVAARRAGVELLNLGFAGQCQIDPFMGRTIGEIDAAVISVKLGINLINAASMTERTFVPAVHGLLDSIRSLRPETPLLAMSPITCPIHENHPGPTRSTGLHVVESVDAPAAARPLALTTSRVRELLATLVAQRQDEGDTALHLMHGTELLGPADVDELYDGLHPTPEGHRRMGERFAESVFGEGGPFGAAAVRR